MPFLSLPYDLLVEIVTLALENGDFEHLMLSSKALYSCFTTTEIPRYNTLKRRWNSVTLDGNADLMSLLCDISREPVAAAFIQNLDLQQLTARRGSSPVHGGDLHHLERLIRASPYIALAKQDPEDWISFLDMQARPVEEQRYGVDELEDAEEACSVHRTAFLLTLLCNLKVLRLPRFWAGIRSDVTNVLNAVSRTIHSRSNTSPSVLADGPLAKLQRLLPSQEVGYDLHPRTGLKDFAAFLALPRLEDVHVSNAIACHDGYTGIEFAWPYASSLPGITSNLTRLHLEGCVVDAEGLGNLLAHTPKLTTLWYSHHTKWHGCGHEWDAGSFVATVGEHCGGTLKEMGLVLDCVFGEVERGITSLENFRALEKVSMDLELLFANAAARRRCQMWSLRDLIPATVTEVNLISSVARDVEVERDVLALSAFLKDGPGSLKITVQYSRMHEAWSDAVANGSLRSIAAMDGVEIRQSTTEEIYGDMPRR